MAITNINLTVLELNTASGNLTDSSGTAASTPADGWEIFLGANHNANRVILQFAAGANADTVTVRKGTKPPAERAGLGDITISLSANQTKFIAVEGARVMTGNNSIRATCTQTTTRCRAIGLPKGIDSGTGVS